MTYDIHGNVLAPGHCEVHPQVAEPYPCFVCQREDRERNPEPVMWQRVASLPDGRKVLITVWDNDPDTIEVCVKNPGSHFPRWSPPLEVLIP